MLGTMQCVSTACTGLQRRYGCGGEKEERRGKGGERREIRQRSRNVSPASVTNHAESKDGPFPSTVSNREWIGSQPTQASVKLGGPLEGPHKSENRSDNCARLARQIELIDLLTSWRRRLWERGRMWGAVERDID